MIDFAVEMAVKAHRGQSRKHTDIPYITHPIGIALLLAQSGCSEELITAALAMIRQVQSCSDTKLTRGERSVS